MANVLVTGATGQLGIHLLPRLAHQRHSIRCLLRSEDHSTALQAAVPDVDFEFIMGTPSDEAALAAGLHDCDIVINLACEAFGSPSAERLWKTNELYAECLARYARQRGVGRFLHVSTALALGASRTAQVLDENSAMDLNRLTRLRLPYTTSRRRGEERILAEAHRGLDAVIVNPGCMAGPECPMAAALSTAPPRWLPSGGLNVVDVRQVADGCLRAIESGRTGQRYILGGDNMTGRALVECLMQSIGQQAPRSVLPPLAARGLANLTRLVEMVRPIDVARASEVLRMFPLFFWYSSQKAIDELGYQTTEVGPAATIRNTVVAPNVTHAATQPGA